MNNSELTKEKICRILENEQREIILLLHKSQTKLVLVEILLSNGLEVDICWNLINSLDYEAMIDYAKPNVVLIKEIESFRDSMKRIENELRNAYN